MKVTAQLDEKTVWILTDEKATVDAAGWEKRCCELEQELRDVQAELDYEMMRREEACQECAAKEREIQELKEQLDTVDIELADTKNALSASQHEVDRITAEKNKKSEEVAALIHECWKKDEDIKDLQGSIKRYICEKQHRERRGEDQ